MFLVALGVEIGLGATQLCRLAIERRLLLGDADLVLGRLELDEQVALLHPAAFGHQIRDQLVVGRADCRRTGGFEFADLAQRQGQFAVLHIGGRNIERPGVGRGDPPPHQRHGHHGHRDAKPQIAENALHERHLGLLLSIANAAWTRADWRHESGHHGGATDWDAAANRPRVESN